MICNPSVYGRAAVAALALAGSVTAGTAAETLYGLDLSRGVFPAGVRVENTGGIPDVRCYARGYTLDGWTVGRYGTRGYVALAPTCMEESSGVCGSVLELPSRVFGTGEWLVWEGLSMLRHFPESYRVEFVGAHDGVPEILCEVSEEDYVWRRRTVSLEGLAGREGTIRIVVTSVHGYMLAMTGVAVIGGFDSWLEGSDLTPSSQGCLDGVPEVRVAFTNLGAAVTDVPMRCVFYAGEGEDAVECGFVAEGLWSAGERRVFGIAVPEEAGSEVRYSVGCAPDAPAGISGLPVEGSVSIGPFARRSLIDKGTGTWCNNCPAGELRLDEFRSGYRDMLLTANTHVNDVLANDGYWGELKWYAVPYMMLNRVRSTEGADTGGFAAYAGEPTDFDIRLSRIDAPDGRTLSVEACVRVAADTDNSGGRYRVGYVLTGDFHDPGMLSYMQENSCNMPLYGVYYYLPSKIPPSLMYYDDVTLTSEGAFDGIVDSLGMSLSPGVDYTCRWSAVVPELLADPSDARVVAYVLDTVTGEVLNADALRVGEEPSSGVGMRGTAEDRDMPVTARRHGVLYLDPEAGQDCRIEVFAPGGARVRDMRAAGGTDVSLGVPEGIYLVRVTGIGGSRTVKLLVD